MHRGQVLRARIGHEFAQLPAQRLRVDGTLGRFTRQDAINKVVQRFRNTLVQRTRRRRFHDGAVERNSGLNLRRSGIGQQLIEHCANRENLVRDLKGVLRSLFGLVLPEPCELFRRTKAVRPRRQAPTRQLFGQRIACTAKVDNDRLSIALPDQNVGQLQIPMQNAASVHVRKRGGNLIEDLQDLLNRGVFTLRPFGKGPPIDVLKRKIDIPRLGIAIPSMFDDVRMVQKKERRKLPKRPRMCLLVVPARITMTRQFERAFATVLLDEVDDCKPSVSKFSDNTPTIDGHARCREHRNHVHGVPPEATFGSLTLGIVNVRPSPTTSSA